MNGWEQVEAAALSGAANRGYCSICGACVWKPHRRQYRADAIHSRRDSTQWQDIFVINVKLSKRLKRCKWFSAGREKKTQIKCWRSQGIVLVLRSQGLTFPQLMLQGARYNKATRLGWEDFRFKYCLQKWVGLQCGVFLPWFRKCPSVPANITRGAVTASQQSCHYSPKAAQDLSVHDIMTPRWLPACQGERFHMHIT